MQLLIHSVLYAVVFSAYVLTTLSLWPRMWLRHYPPNERLTQPPISQQEKRAFIGIGVTFWLLILLGWPIASALWVHGLNGERDAVFVHILSLGVAASAVDWLILDWLLVRALQPTWLIPQDTDPASWRTPSEIRGDAVGFGFGCVLSAALAWIVSRFFA